MEQKRAASFFNSSPNNSNHAPPKIEMYLGSHLEPQFFIQ